MPTWGIDTLPSQRVPQKILKKRISLYYIPVLCSIGPVLCFMCPQKMNSGLSYFQGPPLQRFATFSFGNHPLSHVHYFKQSLLYYLCVYSV